MNFKTAVMNRWHNLPWERGNLRYLKYEGLNEQSTIKKNNKIYFKKYINSTNSGFKVIYIYVSLKHELIYLAIRNRSTFLVESVEPLKLY